MSKLTIISPKTMIRILLSLGFKETRQKGAIRFLSIKMVEEQ